MNGIPKTEPAPAGKSASTTNRLRRASAELVRLLGGDQDQAVLVLHPEQVPNLLKRGQRLAVLRVERGRERATLLAEAATVAAASGSPLIFIFEGGHSAARDFVGFDILAEVVSLTEGLERLCERDRRNWQTYLKLTEKQRAQPKWKPFAAQARQAHRMALTMNAAGLELPEALQQLLEVLRRPLPADLLKLMRSKKFPRGTGSGLPPFESLRLSADPSTTIGSLGVASGLFASGLGGTPWGSPWGSSWRKA
jgi:hypothetical protein